ncbi:hypothetical protein Amal_02435 [Acetobacter malorum]|uniref:Uncharacterized protein n=1 Tax=Acetobacter malorum TaxID=178901 RepID=A0A177GA65_9PROT|nr:hypothetical protein [Acetobacter malorum]OAG76661.1 hypothetical protein Amal_02435 [Acetobacter malorum]
MEGKLVRLGIVIATLILGIFLVSSIYKNFSHLMDQPPGQAEQPAVNDAPAQTP